MSTSLNFCRDQFTAGQISKIWRVLSETDNRKNLITNGKFYVDPGASGTNYECTSTAPCRTLERAVQAAREGAVIYLRPNVHPVSEVSGKSLTLLRWGNSGVVELKP